MSIFAVGTKNIWGGLANIWGGLCPPGPNVEPPLHPGDYRSDKSERERRTGSLLSIPERNKLTAFGRRGRESPSRIVIDN